VTFLVKQADGDLMMSMEVAMGQYVVHEALFINLNVDLSPR